MRLPVTRARLALALAALAGCGPPPQRVLDARWTDADRIGTAPDFYDHVPRNLLMISVDTFRRDHIGAFGRSPTLTPTLDDLARGGVALANHTTCANWTFAGITCTLRGAYNVDNGFIPRLSPATRQPVPQGAGFLAGWLADAGFHTVVHSGNGWFAPRWGNTQGYQVVVNGDKRTGFDLADAGMEEVDLWHRDHPDQPWFLHVHLMEPHAPYTPPPEYTRAEAELEPLPFPVDWADKDRHYELVAEWPQMTPEQQALFEQHLRVRYEGEIKWWDDQLADILVQANARGLLDDTLVVLWNDHGEQFWEHGYQTHAYTLFREENDGWAIFWARNIVPEHVEDPTVSIDLVPTLLSLYGVDLPPEVTGYPLGTRPADAPRYATSVARLGAVQSVRIGDWKMNFNWSGAVRVYDLATDPGEQQDLYDPDDPKTLELWDALEPWVEATQPVVGEYGVNWPLELRNR